MKHFTVIGTWNDNDAWSVGAIEGDHLVELGDDCWVELVEADNAAKALEVGWEKHEERIFGKEAE